MQLGVIGANHSTASVEEREKLLKLFQPEEGILLATCNRVELYVCRKPGLPSRVPGGVYFYRNEPAIRHLFRVAAGLDSQILGEGEILGQVRAAYLRAKGKNFLLDQLFKTAIEIGIKIREETGISRGKVSIASVAAARAKEWLREIAGKKIILIGVGKVSETVLKTLFKLSPNLILVTNRTYPKARALTQKIGGKAMRFKQLKAELPDADLVISSTSAPHLVLKKEQIIGRKKPLLIIDLAAPRDVDPGAANCHGVTLLNIDAIREEINFNLLRRQIEAVLAEKIIEEEVKKFCEAFALEAAAAA